MIEGSYGRYMNANEGRPARRAEVIDYYIGMSRWFYSLDPLQRDEDYEEFLKQKLSTRHPYRDLGLGELLVAS